jgi:hypothetical protein
MCVAFLLLTRKAVQSAASRFPSVPTDAKRFRFISRFRLTVSWHADHVTLMWQKKVQHWEASPPYYPVASGKTLEAATDSAIERYNRKTRSVAVPRR